MSKTLGNIILGSIFAGLAAVSYQIGKEKGERIGTEQRTAEIIEYLELDKYDALQSAKYAGTSKKQDEILKQAKEFSNCMDHIKRY